MMYLPDTNACISFLRIGDPKLVSRWRETKASDVLLCSIVVYELRYGAARCSNPAREHSKLDNFLAPFTSLAFDDDCARKCAEIRNGLERTGNRIGPHDLQIAAVAICHGLTLVTHNTHEFGRIVGLNLEDWES
jgi:tRNA(fMet)-specific endonuclease VapC